MTVTTAAAVAQNEREYRQCPATCGAARRTA
jgi:hypothetical protein